MVATRSRSAALPVLTLAAPIVGLNAVVIVAAAVLARPGEPPAQPIRPPAIAVRGVVAPPAGPSAEVKRPDPPAATAETPLPAPTFPTPPGDDNVEDNTEPVPASPTGDRPAVARAAPQWTPLELQESLLRVPEVWLQHPSVPTVPKTGRVAGDSHPLLAVVAARPDLRGLPVRRGADAQPPPSEAEAFRDASVLLRQGLSATIGQPSGQYRRLAIRPEVMSARPQVFARVIHQMLQTEAVPLRKLLLAHLKRLDNPAASQALAHRAVYEPVADLRREAVVALAGRPAADHLPVLLDAFRNPWPPAADHAADALAALAPDGAVPELVSRLGGPDPSAADERGVPVVRELVRVNHARNCLLCHAQSVSRGDGVRVAVPKPTRRLPALFSLDGYEGGGKGGSRGVGSDAVFVRPDVTYLRQDFSWGLPVANPGPWPALQRFDFVVRTRPAGGADTPAAADSPQRQAMLRALQSLTGRDFGDRAADWRAGLAVAAKSD